MDMTLRAREHTQQGNWNYLISNTVVRIIEVAIGVGNTLGGMHQLGEIGGHIVQEAKVLSHSRGLLT